MEGTMNMISNTSNGSAAASAPHNHEQEAVVSSPTEVVVSSTKKPRVTQQTGGSAQPKPRPQRDAALNCPRCNSNNTKFCYYNNYNLNQPRHFCKACRRYWTQGGSLRLVPIGGCRRNKRASGSSSSSAASSTATTRAKTDKTGTTRLMLSAATTSTVSMPSPATGLLLPNDMLAPFTPTGRSGGISHTMGQDQQGFVPFKPLSLSDDLAPELELALGGSDAMPTLLDMLTEGSFDACGSSSYDAGLASNGMDMSFLPKMGVSSDDPMKTQLPEGMNDDLLWQSYINDDGGYAASPATGMEQQQQQQIVDEQHQYEINNTYGKEG